MVCTDVVVFHNVAFCKWFLQADVAIFKRVLLLIQIIQNIILNKFSIFALIMKAYKYRIFPKDDQKDQLQRFFGVSRLVYSLGLRDKPSYTNAIH